MPSTSVEVNDAMVVSKKDRAGELRRARKMIDDLQARQENLNRNDDDLTEFTEILSTVVNVLQSLELEQSNADDSVTAATLPETVATTATDDELTASCHGLTPLDESYQDDRILYEEPPQKVHHLKQRREQQRQESFNDDILDETDFSQGLSGYENGFYPPEDEDAYSVSESFAGPTAVSTLGFDTPTTRRTKVTASVSEESQCFYCAMHGNEGGCQGTRFCC